MNVTFPLGLTAERAEFEQKTPQEASDFLLQQVKTSYELKCAHEEPLAVLSLERYIILNAIDRLWQEHLYAMDSLREAVGLRAYGQKDPLIEYKNEAYEMFVELMSEHQERGPRQSLPQHDQPDGVREIPQEPAAAPPAAG